MFYLVVPDENSTLLQDVSILAISVSDVVVAVTGSKECQMHLQA